MKNKPTATGVPWPDAVTRRKTQEEVSNMLAAMLETLPQQAVAPSATREEIQEALAAFDFDAPRDLDETAGDLIDLLARATVHTMHPGYFGLFNPTVTWASVLGDQIAASFNPQLAAWSHAPAANDIESRLIAALTDLLGWPADSAGGHFTSGGAEANQTAVTLALTAAHAGFSRRGVAAFEGAPRLYVSAESHHAWFKIAHVSGIGRDAIVLVPTDGSGRMDASALADYIRADRNAGLVPMFVGATAGTTNAGMVDPLAECAAVACRERLWFHVDAAWGGALLVDPTLRAALAGIERADSITIDAHKWFAVSMGAGMFLCRRRSGLAQAYAIATQYMPAVSQGDDPYTHSAQWSRRFIGIRLFLSLATLGWRGYREHLRHSLAMAARAWTLLEDNGWQVVNDSAMAVLNFVDPDDPSLDLGAVADAVVADGRAWISRTRFEGQEVLRACITSHRTTEAHLDALIAALDGARTAARA